MVYSWEDPAKFLNRDVGEYDRERSPNRFLLTDGRILNLTEFPTAPIVNFEIKKERVLQFDCLPNNAQVPLINDRLKLILEELAPFDIQLFPAKLICSDGDLDGYYFMNATQVIRGIDHEKSRYDIMGVGNAIEGFRYLKYIDSSMGNHHIAREDEYKSMLLVSEKVKTIFDKECITGVRLVRPEDYYRPLTAWDLIEEYKRDSE